MLSAAIAFSYSQLLLSIAVLFTRRPWQLAERLFLTLMLATAGGLLLRERWRVRVGR